MGKKYMKRDGNIVPILKIVKIPIFSHDSPKFGLGDGKNGQKKHMEREGKNIRFNTLLVYYYLYLLQDLSCNILFDLTMTLSSHCFTSILNIYTAHRNDWPL